MIAAKTAELEEKKDRLQSLYNVTALASRATTVEELTKGFVTSIRQVARADAAALRWTDSTRQRYLMLASDGLPAAMLEAERCLHAGDCHCGQHGKWEERHDKGGRERILRCHQSLDWTAFSLKKMSCVPGEGRNRRETRKRREW